MKAGSLNHLISLQSPKGSRDSVGERLTSWDTVAFNVPAKIEPISGREEFLAAQRQATTSHTISLRFNPKWSKMDSTWRVLYGARVFTIDAPPRNVGEANCELVLTCTESSRQE